MMMSRAVEREREESAKLIQILYRYYVWKKRAEANQTPEEARQRAHKQFLRKFMKQIDVTSKAKR